jgi:hypothetical protein
MIAFCVPIVNDRSLINMVYSMGLRMPGGNSDMRRVRLPTVSYCRRGRWLHMNHREKSPSRFAPNVISVGLFTAAIPDLPVWIEPGRFAIGSGSAGRSVCHMDFKASRYALNIKK